MEFIRLWLWLFAVVMWQRLSIVRKDSLVHLRISRVTKEEQRKDDWCTSVMYLCGAVVPATAHLKWQDSRTEEEHHGLVLSLCTPVFSHRGSGG